MKPQIIGDHIRLHELVPTLLSIGAQADFSTDGLVVYLDAVDYSNCANIRDDFKFPAFFWRDGYSLNGVPSSLLPLMRANAAFIWLSKSLLESTMARIIWVYAHELRHFMQWRGEVSLIPLQNFLIKRHALEGFSGIGTQLEKPDELDSELFAKQVVNAIIGEEAFVQYLGECRSDPKGDAYFLRLTELEALLSNHVDI
jgi:hypothetical protein